MPAISTTRPFLFAAILALLAVFGQAASATILQTENIATNHPIKLISTFATKDSTFPAELTMDHQIWVVVYATSAASDVYVIGRPGVDPKKLALALEKAVAKTPLAHQTVSYTQTGGYSWADVYFKHGRWLSRESKTQHNVGMIIDSLRKQGFATHGILCSSRWASGPEILSIMGFQGRRYNVNSLLLAPSDLNFTLHTRVSNREVALALFLTFFVPLMCIIALPILIAAARKQRETPEGRRAYFTNTYFWVAITCLAVCITIASSEMRSPWRYRIDELWSGGLPGGYSLSMLCFTLLPLTGLLVFVPLSKLIARLALRGHSKDAVKPLPWYRRGILRGTTALILLGIIFGVVRRTLPEDSLAYTHGFVVICVVILVLDYLLARASKLIRWLPGRATRDSALFGHLMELAEQFRLRLRAVELVDADHFRPPLVMRRGVLRIRTDIAEELSRDELDFAAAAEFAQLARRHTYNEALLLTIATAVTSIYGYLFISEPPNLSVMNVKMWGTILGLLMFIIEGNWLRRSRARAADLAALECTGDAKAAVDAVMKVSGLLDRMQNPTKHLRNPQIDLLTPARLAWLRKAAGDENIIAPSILGGLTEDEALTDRAQEIAARLNVELKKVWVAESAMGKPLVNAFAIRGGKLAVGREILDSFSRAEIDFVLAHEAAHLKSKHGTRMLISISAGFLILIIGVAISSSGDLPLKGPGLWVCMAGCAILTGSMTWMNRLRELEADRIALGITRDLPAAVSVINKLAAGNVKLPEELESYNSHPKYAYRINKLKATARKLGIPDDVEPAYVEDSALGHPDRVGAHIEDDAE